MSSYYIVVDDDSKQVVPMVIRPTFNSVGSACVDKNGRVLLLVFESAYRRMAEHYKDYSYEYLAEPKPMIFLSPIPAVSAVKVSTGLRNKLISLIAVQAGWAFGVPEDGRDEWLDLVVKAIMDEIKDS